MPWNLEHDRLSAMHLKERHDHHLELKEEQTQNQ